MKTIRQFRFYNDGNENNYCLGGEINKNTLASGSVFENKESGYIVSIGIQTLPGTKFHLPNNNKKPVIVGTTGIFELDFQNIDIEDRIGISAIQFDEQSLDIIEEAETGYLIIDLIYDTEVQA